MNWFSLPTYTITPFNAGLSGPGFGAQQSAKSDNWHGNVANSTPDFVGDNAQLAQSIATGASMGYIFSAGNPVATAQGAAAGLAQGIVTQVTAGGGGDAPSPGDGGYDFGGWEESTSPSESWF